MKSFRNSPFMATAHVLFAIFILMATPSFAQNDDLRPTVTSALAITVNEDSKYTFSANEFKFQHATQEFAKVIITRLPSAGSLTLDGTSVAIDQSIAATDLGKLIYQPKANGFGKNYATFRYKVVGNGTKDNTSIEYTATVNVTPVNDKPTVKDVSFTVNEQSHTVAGGPIEVKDASNERNVDTYTYNLVNVTGSDYAAFNSVFEIVKSENQNATIQVKSGATLNYSTKNKYVVYATVKDNAKTETEEVNGPQTSAQFKITVNVKNENDAPIISNQVFTIPEKNKTSTGIEDWTSSKEVAQVVANDAEEDNLTYKVVDTGIPFDFKPGTNSLIVSKGSVLDYETKSVWTFKVSVTDPSGATATATITVNLMDVNENPIPDDVKSEYKVNENTGKDIAFGTFTVTDNDADDELTYTLTGDLADIFYVDEPASSSGKRTVSIRVKNSALLDYEQLYKASSKNASYPVTITITDKGLNSVDVHTKITVVDVNEDLTATGGTFYIQEHSVGGSHVCTKSYDEDCSDTDYGLVSGVDEDKYNKSFSTLHYSISTANTGVKLTDSKSFVVDEDDGSIYTASNAEFEADGEEAKTSYSFYVTVSDETNSKDVLVTVSVVGIDEAPANLVEEGSGKIREDAGEGTLAATFSKEYITDPDELAKFKALGNDVYYKINEDASGYGVFNANSETGDIKLDTDDPTKIDFETLCAKDASCKINGTSPVYVVNMSAFNADQSVTLNITRNIEIVDVNEAPTAKDLMTMVDENISGGTKVGTIEASDPDKYASCKTINNPDGTSTIHHSCGFNTLHYSIVDASGLPFEIDQNTGDIKLKMNEKLRYIDKQKYVFEVKVSDRATSEQALSTTAKVTINVKDNNEPSEFNVLADLYDVDENTAVNETFGDQIIVYDEDAADVCSATSCKLTLTVKDNDACTKGSCAEDLFKVVRDGNTNSKHETPFKFAVKSDLDYEALYKKNLGGAIFNVTVSVTDAAGNETSQATQIRVNDVNEEFSFNVASYEFAVRENIDKDSVLDTAEVRDSDIYNSKFGTLIFSLEGGDAEYFDVDPYTGVIHVINNSKLDYETKSSLKFDVVITDGQKRKNIPVSIQVLDEDDLIKFPSKRIPALTVDENATVGTVVGSVVASDDDCKANPDAEKCDVPDYSLAATEDALDDYKSFTIDNDGTIKIAKGVNLDYEVKNKYVVRVIATNHSDENQKDSVDVTIEVNDVNEKPFFEVAKQEIEIAENALSVEESVKFGDKDILADAEQLFDNNEVVAIGGDTDVFDVDSKGLVFVKKDAVLDYEMKKSYEIKLRVRDANKDDEGNLVNPDLYDDMTLSIVLTDVDDAPVFSLAGYDCNVDENSVAATEVNVETPIAATTSQNGATITYSLIDESKSFTINPSTGVISVAKDANLNYEEKAVFRMILVASDKSGVEGQKVQADSVLVVVSLNDVNEKPVFAESAETFKFPENAKDFEIGTLVFDDLDTASKFRNNKFELVEKLDGFALSQSGVLTTTRKFDYETESKTYELKVRVLDAGTAELAATGSIKVALENEADAPVIADDGKTGYELLENTDKDPVSSGTVVARYDVSDEDADQVASLNVSLTDVDKSGADSLFEVKLQKNKDDSGYEIVLLVKNGSALDYEKVKKSHKIVITATDKDNLKSELSKEITIKDVNEKPVFAEPAEMFKFPENAKDFEIATLVFDDLDTASKFRNNKFELVEKVDGFALSQSGVLTTTRKFDYETESKTYELKVRVLDAGTAELAATGSIKVALENEADAPVIADDGKTGYELLENTDKDPVSSGTVVARYAVTDEDADQVTSLNVSLTDVDKTGADSLFEVKLQKNKDGSGYEIVLLVKNGSVLDYEKVKHSHKIVIAATDKDGLKSELSKEITIKDVKEKTSIHYALGSSRMSVRKLTKQTFWVSGIESGKPYRVYDLNGVVLNQGFAQDGVVNVKRTPAILEINNTRMMVK